MKNIPNCYGSELLIMSMLDKLISEVLNFYSPTETNKNMSLCTFGDVYE